jgi:hypothetical protein
MFELATRRREAAEAVEEAKQPKQREAAEEDTFIFILYIREKYFYKYMCK